MTKRPKAKKQIPKNMIPSTEHTTQHNTTLQQLFEGNDSIHQAIAP
jgi:hypothetical protein